MSSSLNLNKNIVNDKTYKPFNSFTVSSLKYNKHVITSLKQLNNLKLSITNANSLHTSRLQKYTK